MKKGFSFLEILIVIGLIGVFTYIAMISFASKPDVKIQLQNFTTQLIDDLRFVRQNSIILKSARSLTFVSIEQSDTYTSYNFSNEKGAVVERVFPEGLTLTPSTTVLTFDRDGNLIGTEATLTLTMAPYSATIKINSLGFIEVQDP
ncbi:MAG: prepilin-type N-terminal cleavage/methylation domain-containing protein [Dictyoglomaceae bacterium]|nr:prepilin-type N-terminal cleavage/methylation domain-containing protein [Dictyoglomaceae bacterium]HPU42915.1 prepilin-type N-terminal cleavage/methylation domain-containing protein [Dictyoglomaceae bacterium]